MRDGYGLTLVMDHGSETLFRSSGRVDTVEGAGIAENRGRFRTWQRTGNQLLGGGGAFVFTTEHRALPWQSHEGHGHMMVLP